MAFDCLMLAFGKQNCNKKLTKVSVLTDFCHFLAGKCFPNVSEADQKSVKNVTKTQFCHIFVRFLPRMFPPNVSCFESKCVKKVSKPKSL